MAMFLFDVQQRNRLNQDGLLKRFSIDCYGKQKTLEDIRTEKAEKFKELNAKKGTPEYDEWFLKYNPNDKRKRANVKSPEKVKREIILSPDAMEKKKKTVNNKKKLHKKISKKISKNVSKRRKTFEKKFLF